MAFLLPSTYNNTGKALELKFRNQTGYTLISIEGISVFNSVLVRPAIVLDSHIKPRRGVPQPFAQVIFQLRIE